MFKDKYWLIFLMVVIPLVLSACQSANTPINDVKPSEIGKEVKVENGTYKDISVDELQTLLKMKDVVLVNVHIPFEGNLPNTDLSIPYDTISQKTDLLPEDKSADIVLYCRSGNMSTSASRDLVKLGYTNISNLVGGMAAWEQEGLPIER
jgi:rhodanese-related sulfurtransferase